MEDKYIGLLLAVSSAVAIGTSFIITKKGLNDAGARNSYGTSASDNLSYFKNPLWWAGMATLVMGEILNFAAYTFAPPMLVTPLGALSVLVGAILASFLLGEELGHLGRMGCALSFIGSLIIVLHAPEEKAVDTVDEILHFAIQPGFLMYCFTVLVFSLYMIYVVVPKHGRTNPIVYISICSLVGSISVMAVKGFGVAVKLTFAGNNQFTHPSTYFFGVTVALCILVQMNYFNKALDTFSTNVVNPMYYVGFSSATIVASLILFQGFNTDDASNAVSLLAGFITTFLGVHLLNLSRTTEPPLELASGHSALEGGLMHPRMSLQGRMSIDGWNGMPSADRGGFDMQMGPSRSNRHGRQSSLYQSQSTTLFNAFEGEDALQETPMNRHHRKVSNGGTDLHRLKEEVESEDDDDEHGAERALLKKQNSRRREPPPPLRQNGAGSRSHSHSPGPNSPLTDVRITPR